LNDSERDWWSARRRRYNVMLILAGVAAFAIIVIACETVCTANPDFEITAFTTVFQAFGYAVAMAIANVIYNLGSIVERLLKPRNLTLYRRVAFGAGTLFSVMLPIAFSLAVFANCASMPQSQSTNGRGWFGK
jgi:hypothetical protein